jgi:hypothetical protein
MSNSEQFDEICRRVKIVDYLEKKGVELFRTGARIKCRCPLPSHPDDNDPSFYVSEKDNGVQLFKCFGCGEAGNVFKLASLVEAARMGVIVRRLSDEAGVKLARGADKGEVPVPTPDEVLGSFCDEDEDAMFVATYALNFLEANDGSEDAVNKVSRAYRYLDSIVSGGDKAALSRAREFIIENMFGY